MQTPKFEKFDKFKKYFARKKQSIDEVVREPTAGGIVFRRSKKGEVEILLIQDAKDRWTIPKGHIEEGETAQETALREIGEEAGLKETEAICWLGKIHFRYRRLNTLVLMTTQIYLVKALGDTDKIQKEEWMNGIKWFPFHDALDKIEYEDIAPYQVFAREKLGYEFKDIELLVTAMTHRSYMNEHKKSAREHNERLEFLGDAVLELVVTDHLYRNYSEPEGILTSWRSALVRTESIGEAGDLLGYAPLIRLSRGEKHGSDRARQQILANAFEALTGAIYLERGYDDAASFIETHILAKLPGILESGSWRDSKSHLQEVAQSIDGMTPQYRVIDEVGPDHDKEFTLGVYVGDRLMGKGSGPSKQAAQQKAAQAALAVYGARSSQRADSA